jgi:fucose 4-O-acetylase-like acetyltransferase
MSALDPLPVVTSAPKERVAYLDNARYWVMLLVVIGHSLTQFVAMDSARAVYVWIYSFHMPFFILISGYTARRYVGDARQVRRLVSTLVVPYLLVETTLQLLMRHYEGKPDPLALLSPQWLAWFLAALFVWRLTTPIWRALRYPITTSIVISLLVGLIEVPNVLALPKILGFLPFYVVGLHMTRERFLALSRTPVRIAAAVVLVASFGVCYVYSRDWTIDWLLYKARYDESPLNSTSWDGITQRAELLVIGFVLTFAALALVPRRRSWTTDFGSRTFYCYLLHGYVILLLNQQFGVFGDLEGFGAVAALGTIVVAIALANVLMLPVVKQIFRPIFEPHLTWLFRETQKPQPAPAEESRTPADESPTPIGESPTAGSR